MTNQKQKTNVAVTEYKLIPGLGGGGDGEGEGAQGLLWGEMTIRLNPPINNAKSRRSAEDVYAAL